VQVDVREEQLGAGEFHVVGDLVLAYETVGLRSRPGLSMTVYAAEPGSPSESKLRLLASRAAAESAVIPESQARRVSPKPVVADRPVRPARHTGGPCPMSPPPQR
jgi:hypothetical protein